jgi:xanthine dehydrogenase molybdenum-binding subunit
MTEYGTNHGTTYAMVIAEELGCNYSDVHHRAGHPYDSFVVWRQGGSGGMSVNGHAVKKAAQMLKPQILKLACLDHQIPTAIDGIQDADVLHMKSLFPGLTPEDLDIKNGYVYEKANPDNKQPLSAVGARQAVFAGWGPGAHVGRLFGFGFQGQGQYGETGHPHPEMSRLCTMSEVEVDTETGQIFVKKSVFVNDVGKVIQPETCEGQAYGAGIMGISRVLMEEAIYDKATGVKLNDNYIDYKFSTLRDVETTETRLIEDELGYGPYGCTGIGENQSDSAGQGITAALYNATGKWVMEWPLTPDKVLKALGKV